MSLPNQIIVSGAGTAAANGTYTKGADQYGFASWYKDGAQIFNGSAGPQRRWYIYGDPLVGGGPGANNWYQNTTDATGVLSPVGLTFENAGNGTLPAPSVTAPASPSPVEERNAKYATENESGDVRFKRLFSLGYL